MSSGAPYARVSPANKSQGIIPFNMRRLQRDAAWKNSMTTAPFVQTLKSIQVCIKLGSHVRITQSQGLVFVSVQFKTVCINLFNLSGSPIKAVQLSYFISVFKIIILNCELVEQSYPMNNFILSSDDGSFVLWISHICYFCENPASQGVEDKVERDAVSALLKQQATAAPATDNTTHHAAEHTVTYPSRLIYYLNEDTESTHHDLNTHAKNQAAADQVSVLWDEVVLKD